MLDIVTLDVRSGPDNDYNTGDEYSELIPIIALKPLEPGSSTAEELKLLLYPNPSSLNEIYIQNQTDFTNAIIEISTLSGNMVYSKELTQSKNKYLRIKFPKLPAGIYIVSIHTSSNTYSSMLILND